MVREHPRRALDFLFFALEIAHSTLCHLARRLRTLLTGRRKLEIIVSKAVADCRIIRGGLSSAAAVTGTK